MLKFSKLFNDLVMIYRTQKNMQCIYVKGMCNNGDARLLLLQLATVISVCKAICLAALVHTAVISLQPYKEIACGLSSKLKKLF